MLIQSTSVTLMILLHLGAKWGYTQSSHPEEEDDYFQEICAIKKSFKSPYIRAFYEDPLTNCDEDADENGDAKMRSTSTAQEVHVIRVPDSVRASSTASTHSRHHKGGILINFRIKPPETSGVLDKKLIFVLVTNTSIRWKVHLERIRTTSQLEFWISNGSSVMTDARLNMKVQQVNLPSSTEALLDWVSQTLGPITMVTDAKLSRTITHTVGIVEMARKCSDVGHQTVQDISGCLATWNKEKRNKDVHILELQQNTADTKPDATTVHPVIIDIRSKSVSKPLPKKHILLVLKSHQPTKWKVRTTGLRGTLDIVTDYSVDTNGITMQSVRVVNEKMSTLSSSDLIEWTFEKYAYPISYTYAELANKFEITVDDQPDEGKAQQVNCNPKNMVVSLSKNFKIKTPPTQLSLIDPSCKAHENTTHYFWTTSLTACGTNWTQHNDQITYRNAIVIRVLKTSSERSDQVGSGLEPSDDRTLLDDESLSTDVIHLDFQCTYQTYQTVKKGPGPPSIYYNLKLYKDPDFQLEMLHFPVVIGDRQKLYVEARVVTDLPVQVIIQNCTLSLVPYESPGYHLVRNGCPYEDRVKWIETGGIWQRKRFEFDIENFSDGDVDKTVNLDCKLSSCTKFSQDASFHQCPLQEQNCLSAYRASSVGHHTFSKSLGPLLLQSNVARHGDSVQDLSTQGIMLYGSEQKATAAGLECDQIIHSEGLDPPAVVGIAFAAFTIGVLLTGALWFIHSHTGPLKKHAKGLRSAETSGESTPSSTAPMAIRPLSHHHHV